MSCLLVFSFVFDFGNVILITFGFANVEIIKKKADIKIEIIDGKKEAAIIASTDLHYLLKTEKTYLYVDVGGGSTEFSLFSDGKMIASKSFKIGTVRLLNQMVNDLVWQEIEKWIKTYTNEFENVTFFV